MCYGTTYIYSCCGAARVLYTDMCPVNDLLYLPPHRVLGRTYRVQTTCYDCRQLARQEEEECARRRARDEIRAKALLEYFRGERDSPFDDNVLERLRRLHVARILVAMGDTVPASVVLDEPWPNSSADSTTDEDDDDEESDNDGDDVILSTICFGPTIPMNLWEVISADDNGADADNEDDTDVEMGTDGDDSDVDMDSDVEMDSDDEAYAYGRFGASHAN
jgi:hypothetical protein